MHDDDAALRLRALREEIEHYHTLFDNMGEGVSVCEVVRNADEQVVDLIYLEMNKSLERHTGLGRGMMLGRRFSDIFPPSDIARWLPIYGEVANTGEPATFEMPADLLGRWFEVSAYSWGSDRLTIIFRDVTERKRAEAILRESEFEIAKLLVTKGIPFVFLTGYDLDVIPSELADTPRLQKPVPFRSIVDTVSLL